MSEEELKGQNHDETSEELSDDELKNVAGGFIGQADIGQKGFIGEAGSVKKSFDPKAGFIVQAGKTGPKKRPPSNSDFPSIEP